MARARNRTAAERELAYPDLPDLFGDGAGLLYADRGLDRVALGRVSRGDSSHKETSACPRSCVRRGGYQETDVPATAGRNVGKRGIVPGSFLGRGVPAAA